MSERDRNNLVHRLAKEFDEMARVIESALCPSEEMRLDYMGNTHVIALEVTPISAFTDKAGMKYDSFKEKYPNFVKWIESNGWTYDAKNDRSL